jgi:hypothetical protein
MSRLRLILRWVGALLVAVLVHVSVLGLGALIWQHFGTDPVRTLDWTLSIATFVAVLVGAIVVPRGQWKAAALAIWKLAIVYYLWFVLKNALTGHFSSAALGQFTYALLGGAAAYYAFRSGLLGGLRINSVAKKSPSS